MYTFTSSIISYYIKIIHTHFKINIKIFMMIQTIQTYIERTVLLNLKI